MKYSSARSQTPASLEPFSKTELSHLRGKARMRRASALSLVAAVAAVLTSHRASAATSYTWNVAGVDGSWATTTNWTPAGLPGTTDTAIFSNTGSGTITTGAISLANLQFDANASAFTIGGATAGTGTITFDATSSVTSASSNNQLINANVLLGTAIASTTTVTNNGTGTLTFAGSIQGGTGGTGAQKTLAVNGTGDVVFGTVGKGGATGVTVAKSNTGTVTFGGTVDNNSAGLTLSGGTAILAKSSGGSVHSLGGSSTVTTGLLQLAGTGGDQVYDGATITVNGGVFDLNGRSEAIGGLAAAAAGGLVYNSANGTTSTLTFGGSTLGSSQSFAGTIQDNAGNGATGIVGVAKNNAGTYQILSGTNTYTGTTAINAGVLHFSRASALPSATSITVGATGGIGLGVGTGGFTTGDIDALFASSTGPSFIIGPNNNTITVNSASMIGIDPIASTLTYSLPANAVSTHGLAKFGSNTLILPTANNYSGGTQLNGGTVVMGNAGSLGSGAISVGGTSTLLPTVDLSGTNKLTNSLALNSSTFTIAGNTNIEFGGTVTGNAAGPTLTISNGGLTKFSGTSSGLGVKTLNLATAGTVEFPNGINLSNGGGQTINGTAGATINGIINLTGTAGPGGGADVGTSAGVPLTINAVIASTTAAIDFYNNNTTPFGTTILNGANTYTTQTQINRQIVQVGSLNSVATNATTGTVKSASSNLGAPSDVTNGTIRIVGGSTLKYVGTGETTDRVIALYGTTDGATLDQSGSGVLKFVSDFTAPGTGSKALTLQGSTSGVGEIAGAIVNNGATNLTSLIKAGTGTWTLSGVNTYTGSTSVNGGTLNLTGTLGSTAITVGRAGTLTQGSTGLIGGSATLTNVGSTTLSGTNTYTGATTLANGTLTLDFSQANTASNIISSSSALVLSGGALQVNGKANVANTQTFASTTINPGGSSIKIANNATANNVALNLGAITRNAGGTVDFVLPANGTASASNGVVTSTANNAAGILGGYATVNGTDWAVNDGAKIVALNSYETNVPTAGGSATTNYRLDGALGLSGDAAFNSIKIADTAAGHALALGGATATIGGSGGGILYTGNSSYSISGGTLTAGSNELILNTAGSGTLNVAAIVGGTGGLTKSGSGTLVLATGNTFTGNVYISGGVLEAPATSNGSADSTVLGGGNPKLVTLSNNATFRLVTSGNNSVYNPTANSKNFVIGTGGGTLEVGAGATMTLDDGNTNTGSGTTTGAPQLQGTGTLTKSGAGLLQLGYSGQLGTSGTGFLGFTGDIVVAAGTLQVGNQNALGSTAGTTTVLSGGTLDFFSQATTLAESLTLSGTGVGNNGALINSSANAVTVSGNVALAGATSIGGSGTGALTISGSISNTSAASSLTKVGTGTVTLNGANTLVAGTAVNVNAGTLAIGLTGSISGVTNLTVASSATLDVSAYAASGGYNVLNTQNFTGAGNIKGDLNVGGTLSTSGTVTGSVSATAGTIAPGALGSVGTLNITGNLSLNSTAKLSLDLGTTAVASSDSISLSSGTTSLGSSTLSLSLLPSFAGSVGDTFTLIINGGSSAVAGVFGNVIPTTSTTGTLTLPGGQQFQVNYAANLDGGTVGNDVTATLVAVPEPSTFMALLGGVGALVGFSRRRSRLR